MRVAVIGLGCAGLAACASLARAGHAVWGFEREAEGAAQGSSRGDTRIFRLTPGEGPVYVDLAGDAVQRWRALEQEAGTTLLDWRPGYMGGPSGSAFVESCIRLGREHGRDHAVLGSDDVRAQTNGWVALPPDWVICRLEDCAIVDAPAALAAMANAARAHGAELAWASPVAAPIESTCLRVGGVEVAFDRVVVAGGPWLPSLAPELARVLVVTRKTLAWMVPKGRIPAPALPILCLDDHAGVYGMQTSAGLFKVGLDAVGQPGIHPDHVPPVSQADAASLEAAVRTYLPRYDPRPHRTDTCLYTMTADWNFVIRPLAIDHRVLGMSCCSGHGFKYAPSLGEIARAWVEGEENRFLRWFSGDERPPPAVGSQGHSKSRGHAEA